MKYHSTSYRADERCSRNSLRPPTRDYYCYPRRHANIKARNFTKKLLLGISSFADIAKLENMGHRIDLSLHQAYQLYNMAASAKKLCELVGMASAKKKLFTVMMMKLAAMKDRRDNVKTDPCNFMVLGPRWKNFSSSCVRGRSVRGWTYQEPDCHICEPVRPCRSVPWVDCPEDD